MNFISLDLFVKGKHIITKSKQNNCNMELLNQNPKYIIIDSVLTNYSMLMASKSQALDVKTIYKKKYKTNLLSIQLRRIDKSG